MQYANAANTITQVKPNSAEIIVANTVPNTEKHPLIPIAQGIFLVCVLDRYFIPEGKGIPIKNDRGAIIKNDSENFKGSEYEIVKSSSGLRKKGYKIRRAMIRVKICLIFFLT